MRSTTHTSVGDIHHTRLEPCSLPIAHAPHCLAGSSGQLKPLARCRCSCDRELLCPVRLQTPPAWLPGAAPPRQSPGAPTAWAASTPEQACDRLIIHKRPALRAASSTSSVEGLSCRAQHQGPLRGLCKGKRCARAGQREKTLHIYMLSVSRSRA